MGVKGLLKYIRSYSTGVKPEPLVLSTETKRKSRDPTAAKAILVCDFIAIVFWLLDIVHDAKKSSERYIALYGADFKEYTSRLIRFVEMLRHIDIEPVFFWDGPRGSGNAYRMKLSTWEKRTKDSLEVILSHSLITKYDAKTEVKFGKRIKQPLVVTELVMALQEAKVELITCKGEADNLMAEYMRVHGNVCGILTNDTDMMLMNGVTAIHHNFFDQEDALKLSDDHIPANYKISEVHCGAISPGYLARCLKINEKCLPALSILCGNDFTKDLNEEMDIKNSVFGYINYDYVKTYEYIKTVLKWIKDNEDACMDPVSFLALREIADVCKKKPRYAAAVHYSYAFYTRSHPAAVMPSTSSNSVSRDSDDESEESAEEEYDDTTAIPYTTTDSIPKTASSSDSLDDETEGASLPDSFFPQSDSDSTVGSDDSDNAVSPLYDFVVFEVSSLRLDRKCLPVVKNGILWRDEIEQLDDELPCIYDVLQPVRMIIYKLLCCESVTEFGQSKINEYAQKQIKVNPCMPEDIDTLIEELSREQKISLLVEVFKEPYHIVLLKSFTKSFKDIPPTSRVPDIGSLLACVCFIYSYQNKLIPEDYVTPILQAFFYCSIEKLPPRISARPGPKGVTMSSHLMITLTHARWFLSLLGIHQELPLPSSVFQPYVYIPLHGTAFKLKEKQKFHGDDAPAKEYYELLSKNKVFQDFKRCICSGSAIDNIGAVCVQYACTKDAIKELLDKKAQSRKTSKSRKK
ncbi:PREDICTED: uncharacterized protein LOC109583896 [Amphimedon queenslandica]|uniref:Uncharacterized protein n=1 Tax=Amphimedon queenslandica TaxID=400682 RepID=A0A1X7UDH8_AMPQE|nr:PREDICTED: uncharacterized protein LOC109583896 [Amphimedon queenslandica]|eukprot:XP_019854964.1 PREDICTED: uncharacterized protein LOC109583896 [Amphimedon queenslandica]